MTGVVVLLVALVASAGFGITYRARNGRLREVAAATDPAALALAALVPAPGEKATLLQFSSAFCAPCRATRQVLAGVAQLVPGVVHVEVDAEAHLDAVRALDVRRTPTVLILDADRRVARRASGQPRRDEVLATLSSLFGSGDPAATR
jgi:thiol-disulfide isomerase/thioredoxin